MKALRILCILLVLSIVPGLVFAQANAEKKKLTEEEIDKMYPQKIVWALVLNKK